MRPPAGRRLTRRFTQLFVGVFLYGVGIAFIVRGAIGAAPWDVLAQGIANHLPFTFGTVTIGVSLTVLLLWIPLRQKPGFGTLVNAIGVGPAADLVFLVLPQATTLWLQVVFFVIGLVVLAAATGLYIGAHFGPGPRDGLMTGLSALLKLPIWIVRTALEVTVVLIGWLLGGNVGAGTIAFALLIGPLCQFFLRVFAVRLAGGEDAAHRPGPAERKSPMTGRIDIIISQGRVGDRTPGALPGALRTGTAIAERRGVTPRIVGTPSQPAQDDWSVALPSAEATLTAMREALNDTLDAGRLPVLTTNTCGVSIGTLPTVAERFPDAVVLWIDAHGDFNTPESTGSGYLGGMVLAAACGLWDSGHGAGLDPRQVIVVGGRDIDPVEGELLADAGVTVLPPAQSTPERVVDLVAGRPVWIHVDWDVLEPGFIPAAYRVDGGLLPEQVAAIFAALPTAQVRGVELAEFEDAPGDVPALVSVEHIVKTFDALGL